mmetsp:Transcript_23001/g.28195  ORF Transcript_23001/g.28195 Transcript_23001/m.28195 type:complete len:97 (-) Transcript_23001:668-958(-)
MESFARSVASPELFDNLEIAFLRGGFLAVHVNPTLLVRLRVKQAVPAQTQAVVVIAARLSSVLESIPSAFGETGDGEDIVTECGAEVSFGFIEFLE